MAIIKEEREEFALCLCMINGAVFLFVGFFFVMGLMMAVMAISFALPIHIFESLFVAKNGKLTNISFQKLPICYHNYHNHLGNNLQILLIPFHILAF